MTAAAAATGTTQDDDSEIENITFVDYMDESQLDSVMSLVGRDLSEPYSIFTYRYFLSRFPELCIIAVDKESQKEVGCVVGKVDVVDSVNVGYIGMLAVDKTRRRCGIGTALVKRVLQRFQDRCKSVTLETEVTNKAAQKLYEDGFGFIREELLVRYYLNWGDAYRLRLWFDNENKNLKQEE